MLEVYFCGKCGASFLSIDERMNHWNRGSKYCFSLEKEFKKLK